jgi:hypothetical protein
MSWIKLTMKFPGTCMVCNQKIEANEVGVWAKGIGVKHEKCAKQEVKELKCIICGGPAGCQKCEFFDDCNRELVSEYCICKKCGESKDSFANYQNAVKKSFPLLNLKT